MSIVRQACLLSSLAIGASLAPPVMAAGPLDTFSAHVGGYLSTFDTQVRADGQTTTGTSIDLNRDLGLDSDNAITYVGLTWRPWAHHEFGASAYGDDLEKTKVLGRQIEFDGNIYEADATVRAKYSLDAYEAYYIWWAASHETWALGPRIGLVWYSADLAIDLQAVSGELGGARSAAVSADLPAPSIGGSWRWSPSPQWRISADVGYFTANINDIDAEVIFSRAGVEWFAWEHFGFSLDYVRNSIRADARKDDFSGRFDFVDSGLRLGAVYRF